MSEHGEELPANLPEPTREPPANPPAPGPEIEIRDGRINLGDTFGWCNPDEFLQHVQAIFDAMSSGQKTDRPLPKVFSKLSLMLLFGMTRQEWKALAKLPEWKRVCEMVETMSEAWLEAKLAESSGRNPAGVIFALKNHHDWKDQPDQPPDDAVAALMAAVVRLPQKRLPPIKEADEVE